MSLMPATTHNGASLAGVEIDHAAILTALNLDPRDAKTQALLLVCDRYGMDPLLKHMVLIQGSPYITRDGYLAIAHRSGQFDGMEVLEQTVDQTHYIAKVAVYRKDMSRPITMVGRFPKSKNMAKEYGPEMAVKCAEVAAMRRAFNVTGVADERWDDDPDQRVEARSAELAGMAGALPAGDPFDAPPPDLPDLASDEQRAAIKERTDGIRAADADTAKALAAQWKANGITAFAHADRFTVNDVEALEPLLVQAETLIANLRAEGAIAANAEPVPTGTP